MGKYDEFISKIRYNRESEKWGLYRVDEFDEKINKFKVKFKNSGHVIETSLKNIKAGKVIDIVQQKKDTEKRKKAKKKKAKDDRKFAKSYISNLGVDPILLSIDASTHSTGISIFAKGKLIHYDYIYQSKTNKWDTSRINYMKNEIIKVIDKYNVNCVAMEDVIMKNMISLYVLSKLQGVLCDYFYKNNIKYLKLTPKEWKGAYNINRADATFGANSREESKEKTVKCVNLDFNLSLESEFKDSPRDLSEPAWYDVADAIGVGVVALKRIKK